MRDGQSIGHKLATIAIWPLVTILGWVLYRLTLALVRDFWVIIIAWSQP